MISTVLLAAGSGTRANSARPKQFIEVNGKPLFWYTIKNFIINTKIDLIVIVCDMAWKDYIESHISIYKNIKRFIICQGGSSGLESAYNGFNSIPFETDEDIVLIHDAARPFVDQETINNCIEVSKKYGVGLAAVDCVDTLVYTPDDLSSTKLISRDNLKRILTPQAFRVKELRRVFSNRNNVLCSKEPSTFAYYMQQGFPVYCAKSNEKNIKITYPEDLEYFKLLFSK